MNHYRTPAPRRTDTEDVVEFLRRIGVGPELPRKRMLLRVTISSLLMLVALRFWCIQPAMLCAIFAVCSLPPFQRWWIRRRLRRAGLLQELAEYEASLETR